jgi:hypothetical protein
MPKLNEQGFAQIFVLLTLLLGITGGVYLVQRQTNLLSFAEKADNIQFVDLKDNLISQTSTPQVRVKITSPNGLTPTITPTPPTKEASLSANPNPCTIYTTVQSCSSTISWNTKGYKDIIIRIKDSKGAVIAKGESGTQTVSGINQRGYEVGLYSGNELLKSVELKAALKQGTYIMADPNPCVLSIGQRYCKTTLYWNSPKTANSVTSIQQKGLSGPFSNITIKLGVISGSMVIDWLYQRKEPYVFELYSGKNKLADVTIPVTIPAVATPQSSPILIPIPTPVVRSISTAITTAISNIVKPLPIPLPNPTAKTQPLPTAVATNTSIINTAVIGVILAEDPNITLNTKTIFFNGQKELITDYNFKEKAHPDGYWLYAQFITADNKKINAAPFPAKIAVLTKTASPSATLTPTPNPTLVPTPQATAPATFRRVFVTSSSYSPNFGGVFGADTKCQQSAEKANLGGKWTAWLSDGSHDVKKRFEYFDGPYKLLNGTIIANNWTELTSKSLLAPINITEFNQRATIGITAWSGTLANGQVDQINTCLNWTKATSSYSGSTNSTNSTSLGGSGGNLRCDSGNLPIYCFEQLSNP